MIIRDWFAHLNWGPEKLIEEREFIREHMRMGYTTEVSGNWSVINEIYENGIRRVREEFPHVADITMLGGHSSHSYQTGTNMYFVYDYNVVDCTIGVRIAPWIGSGETPACTSFVSYSGFFAIQVPS